MAKWLLVLQILCAASAWSQTPALGSVEANRLGVISETDQQIRTLQGHLKQAPGDFAEYDRLGFAFFQKARETGDIAYYDLAEQTLDKALALTPRDFRAADSLLHMALVYMGEHRFSDALRYAQKAIGTGSGNLSAFAIEGDAYTDMGDYEEAAAAYNTAQSLGRATSSPLAVACTIDSRMAYLRFLHGDSAEAIRLMKSAIAAALQTNIPRENLAWLYFELGERYFPKRATWAMLICLINQASWPILITIVPSPAWRKFGLGKGSWKNLFSSINARLPSSLFRRTSPSWATFTQKAGRIEEAQQQYDLVEYIGHLGKLNQVLANRELALFYADRGIKLPEALELARNELEVRHDIYTWDILAWALYRNGKCQEAAEAIEKALALHTNDSLLLFHAGMIYHSLGKDSDARDFLSRALKTNPHFHVLQAQVASRTLEDIAPSHKQDLRSDNAQTQR